MKRLKISKIKSKKSKLKHHKCEHQLRVFKDFMEKSKIEIQAINEYFKEKEISEV